MFISLRQCAEPLKLPINIKYLIYPIQALCHAIPSTTKCYTLLSDCLLAVSDHDYSCPSDCTLAINLHHYVSLKPLRSPGQCRIFSKGLRAKIILSLNTVIPIIVMVWLSKVAQCFHRHIIYGRSSLVTF